MISVNPRRRLPASFPPAAMLFLALVAPAAAQEPEKPPFTFPFRIEAGERIETVFKPGANTVVITGGVTVVAKDVRVVADQLEWDGRQQRAIATGNVTVTRGDETIKTTYFVFEGVAGMLIAENATAISPPFRISGTKITQTAEELRADEARLALRPDGGGELRFRAQELRIRSRDNRLILRNPTLYLYGTRLITLTYVSVPLGRQNADTQAGAQTPPITFRHSPASGFAIGLGNDVTILPHVVASAQVEATTRLGVQYTVGLRESFLNPPEDLRSRRSLPVPGGAPDPEATPLQRILTARKPPPPFDPVLDYTDILASRNLVAQPTQYGLRSGFARVVYSHNREVGGRRQGIVLVSLKPQAMASVRLPLAHPLTADDNAAARRQLRTPRFALMGEASIGKISELRLNQTPRPTIEQDRTGGLIGLGLQPLLVGQNLLVGGLVSYQFSHYGDGESFRYMETALAAALPWRTASVGAAYIRRTLDGSTPFIYDSVDTQDEAQARAEIRLSRFTLAGLMRYDMGQNKLFDTEIAIGLRGNLLEPRFSYRTLNGGQFSFSIAIVGLSAF